MSERQACKLVNLDRSSYRYEPMPDHNAQLREQLVDLARQKPRYGYRRLHALLLRRGQSSSPQRVYRVYKREGLAVRRLRRKRLSRPAALYLTCIEPTRSGHWTLLLMHWRQVEGFVCWRLSTLSLANA